MKALRMFSIPIKGLGSGKHNFEYNVKDEFFNHFEESNIKTGSFTVQVHLDKQIRMMEFNFEIEGTFKAQCDRCLEDIMIPTKSSDRLLAKIGEEEVDDNEEVIYIDENANEINLAPFIYEFIHLSKPLKNVKDCEQNDYADCDLGVLDKMSVEEEEEKSKNPIWEQLKNIELGQ